MRTFLLLCPFLIPLVVFSPQSRYRSNPTESTKAAQEFEETYFSSEPKLMKLIGFFHIEPRDGHLLVVVNEPFMRAEKKTQNKLFFTLQELWTASKYVKGKNYAPWVEVMIHDRFGKPRYLRTLR